jgi:cell filamentation protein
MHVKDHDRYDASHLAEGQFQGGSSLSVLKNLMGIKSAKLMDLVETAHLARTEQRLTQEYDARHRFTARDIRRFHQAWLRPIYGWAGEYRQVNVSKAGFMFAAANRIPALMQELEEGPLRRCTPCVRGDDLAAALSETHVELVLIHPFRDGNGRVARMLANMMALQAGLPPLDFSVMTESRETYFAAVRAGLEMNYKPMTSIFEGIIERSTAHA